MASIRKRGERWQARVTRRGYPAEVRTFSARAEAEKWARSVEAEIDRGTYVSRFEAERLTLGDVLQRYAEEVTPSKRGAKDEAIRIGALRRHRIAATSMANLSPRLLAEFRDERLETCNAATVIRDFALLSAVINHGRREWNIAISNPVQLIRKPSAPKGRDRVLLPEEEARLLAELAPEGRRSPYLEPVVVLALETAMRRGELLALQWAHVDLSRRVAHLPLTKNGDSRSVPLSTRAVDTLRRMPRSIDGRVFPISDAAMEAAFAKACRRAELVNLRFHDLRHTATTRLFELGLNIMEVATITGHKDLRMLRRYTHLRAEDLARKLR